jgi:carbon monoxide dehydrogenase subunit G
LRKTVQAQTTIAASPEVLFECLSDYQRAEVFIEGLQELTPTGPKTQGEGAQFDAVLKVGPSTLRSTIEIAEVERDRSITWSSAGEDGQSLRFDLAADQRETSVSLVISYEEPGGIGGAIIAPFVEHTVRERASGALERLREHVSSPQEDA